MSAAIFSDYIIIRKDKEMLTLLRDAITVAVSKHQERFQSADLTCKRWAHFPETIEIVHARLFRRDLVFKELLRLKRCLECVESWQYDLAIGAEETSKCYDFWRNTNWLPSNCDLPDLWKQQVEMMRVRGSCHVKDKWFREDTKAGIFDLLEGLKKLDVTSKDLKEVRVYTKKGKYIEALFTLQILFIKFNLFRDQEMLVRLFKTTWDACLAYWRLKVEKCSPYILPPEEYPSTRDYARLCKSGWRIVARWYELQCQEEL